MSAEVTIPIDKSGMQMLHGDCCQVPGEQHRRAGWGRSQSEVVMVKVINTEHSFRLEWCCRLCGRKCTLDELWLAIPRGQQVEAQWAHRACLNGVNGQIEAAFGTRRITLMRGIDAIRRLAESLEVGDVDGPDATAQRNGRRRVTAKA